MSADLPPAVSVALASDRPGAELTRCLDSLRSQNLREPFEIVVACGSAEMGSSMAVPYPEVRFVHSAEGLSKPQLLKSALENARGEVVVVTEPYCYFPADWLEKIRLAHRRDFCVIGGAVEYGGPDTALGWACHLADYGPFLLPAKSRVTDLLPGNHVSYRRSALDQVANAWRNGYAKVFVLRELERRGFQFFFDSELVVWCAPETTFRGFASTYFRNAVEFAATRALSLSTLSRIAHVVTAPALPVLLLLRRVHAIWGNQRYRCRVVRAMPLMGVFVLCWSAGELIGYLRSQRP